MLEFIEDKGQLIAIFISNEYKSEKDLDFLTEDSNSLQLAFMNHSSGTIIQSHYHNNIERCIPKTQEVLVIKSGKIRVDLYDDNQALFESKVLTGGDIMMFCSGGHGFEILEDVEMFEVKNGPYLGDIDKTKF